MSALNVIGEPYGKALAILKSQNVKAFFGGSVGSDLPQAACIVSKQKITTGGRMYLSLDCTQKAADDATGSQPVGRRQRTHRRRQRHHHGDRDPGRPAARHVDPRGLTPALDRCAAV